MAQAGTTTSAAARRARPPRPGDPAIGTSVTLVPAGDARLITGTLLSWESESTATGENVRASVDVAPTSAHGGAVKVWATLHAAGDVIVVSADASASDAPHILMLLGRVAAREPRRR